MLIRRRFRSNIHPIGITDPISDIYIHSAPLVAVYSLIYISVRDSKLVQAKPYCPRRSCTRCALAYKKAVNIAVVRGIHWVRQLPYAHLTKVRMNALLLQAHTDIFFRYPGGFFEFICVFSYACFLICIQFLMFFYFVWIGFLLIPAHESLSAEEVICQVIVYRTHDHAFIHHKVGSPSVSKSSLCPESSNKSILYRQIFVPSEKDSCVEKIRKQICQI